MRSLGAVLRSVGSQLPMLSGRNGQTRQPVWGEGIAEVGLTTLWAPCRWSEVNDDELIFLNPSLAHQRASGLVRIRCLLSRTFCEHLRCLAGTEEHLAARRALRAIQDCAGFTGQFVGGAVADCPGGCADAVDAEAYDPWQFVRAGVSSQDDRERWTFELAVLTCLGRMLEACAGPGDGSPTPDEPDLADAVAGSVHSRINAGYVFPQLTGQHEMLTAAAWIGCLLRQRNALLPIWVAEPLTELLREPDMDTLSVGWRCQRLLRFHAEIAFGADRLLAISRSVATSGIPREVRPRGRPARLRSLSYGDCRWNPELFACLEKSGER
jgi:hypothetical protein